MILNTSKIKQIFHGRVVSDSADKTLIVEVASYVKYPKYKKYFRKIKRYHVHDESNQYKKGERVIIESSRPLSKTKKWKVVEKLSPNKLQATS